MGSCINLGFCYEQGTGVGQDAAKAAALYRKACDGGQRQACAKAR
jgi:TPR repeat protein